jgi:hypothetical protein
VKRNSPIGFIVTAFLLLAFSIYAFAQKGEMGVTYTTPQEGEMGVKEIANRVVHESLKLGGEDYVLITTWWKR